ncbi:MAG: hypothetical protein KBF83_04905 [Pyrinomonadaceae bacterium]|nr:hypothetical protein [Pyrinomonadaceae bacterium]MBP9108877.1 hypothetical protein [Pyrinomonadaceae bacterium]
MDEALEKREIVTDIALVEPRVGPSASVIYLVLPAILLAVTLLGGLRLGVADNAFIFLKPALICLVFAAVTMVLFVRSGMVAVDGWLARENSSLRNVANAAVLLTLFTALVQLYNSLLPEQGLPFWIVGFCFFWTLWNNLFAEFDPKRLLRSMAALFAMAFAVRWLFLANLTPETSGSWIERILQNPTQEAFTWLLDIPRYSAGTGYIQFFTLALFLLGLYLLPRSASRD